MKTRIHMSSFWDVAVNEKPMGGNVIVLRPHYVLQMNSAPYYHIMDKGFAILPLGVLVWPALFNNSDSWGDVAIID